MKKKSTGVSKEARHGEKMIEIKLRFWTNKIAKKRGHILQKHVWSGGMVNIESNDLHGIRPGKWLPFHSLMDVSAVVEKVLIRQGIIVHPSRKSRKYTTGL